MPLAIIKLNKVLNAEVNVFFTTQSSSAGKPQNMYFITRDATLLLAFHILKLTAGTCVCMHDSLRACGGASVQCWLDPQSAWKLLHGILLTYTYKQACNKSSVLQPSRQKLKFLLKFIILNESNFSNHWLLVTHKLQKEYRTKISPILSLCFSLHFL